MKKLVFILVCMGTLHGVFSQENEAAEHFILHTENIFSLYDYQLYNGTPLNYKQLNSLLVSVPENEKLLKQASVLRVLDYVFAALAVASLTTLIVYDVHADWDYAGTISPVAYSVGIGALFGELITYEMGRYKYEHAIDNYNLSVMGIPIPVKNN